MSKNIHWLIGCPGFHYKEWKNEFYPALLPQRLWFNHYAKHFNTLELNVTFYQFPKLSSLQKWFEISPGDFIFSLKVPRSIETAYLYFNNTAGSAALANAKFLQDYLHVGIPSLPF